MKYGVDPRVDAYIASLPDWQQVICRKVREFVHRADPDIVETIKRTKYLLPTEKSVLVAAVEVVGGDGCAPRPCFGVACAPPDPPNTDAVACPAPARDPGLAAPVGGAAAHPTASSPAHDDRPLALGFARARLDRTASFSGFELKTHLAARRQQDRRNDDVGRRRSKHRGKRRGRPASAAKVLGDDALCRRVDGRLRRAAQRVDTLQECVDEVRMAKVRPRSSCPHQRFPNGFNSWRPSSTRQLEPTATAPMHYRRRAEREVSGV